MLYVIIIYLFVVFFYNFKKLGFEKLKLVILNKLVIYGNWKNNVVRKKNEIGL